MIERVLFDRFDCRHVSPDHPSKVPIHFRLVFRYANTNNAMMPIARSCLFEMVNLPLATAYRKRSPYLFVPRVFVVFQCFQNLDPKITRGQRVIVCVLRTQWEIKHLQYCADLSTCRPHTRTKRHTLLVVAGTAMNFDCPPIRCVIPLDLNGHAEKSV